jgi:hypothetical protein
MGVLTWGGFGREVDSPLLNLTSLFGNGWQTAQYTQRPQSVVTAVMDAAGRFTLYLNGQLLASYSGAVGRFSLQSSFLVGAQGGNGSTLAALEDQGGPHFHGRVHSVLVVPRAVQPPGLDDLNATVTGPHVLLSCSNQAAGVSVIFVRGVYCGQDSHTPSVAPSAAPTTTPSAAPSRAPKFYQTYNELPVVLEEAVKGLQWDLWLTGPADGLHSLEVVVQAGHARDLAGRFNADNTTRVIEALGTVPSVSLSSPQPDPTHATVVAVAVGPL